jgi:hypothetical protein
LTDEPTVETTDAAREATRGRRWPRLGIACACLLLVAGGVLYVQIADPFRTDHG